MSTPRRRQKPAREPAGLAARRIAVEIVDDALHRRQTLDAALDVEHGQAGLAALEPRDRAFVKVLATETIRRHGQIRALLSAYLDKPLPKSAGRTMAILEVGACQILFLDVPAHAVVDTAVGLAAADRAGRHFRGLVNAVLRRVAGDREALLARPDGVRATAPDWLAQRWIAAYGAETAQAIMAAHLAEPPLDLTVKSDPQGWADQLGGAALPTGTVRIPKAGDIAALPGFADGAWWVQDVAAALPARLLGDVAGLRVADICAAPGGKTAQLAAAGASVTAVDRSASRMARLEANLARLGLAAEPVVADAAAWEPGTRFDAILLDAPCSATGTLRRHPDIAWIRREAEIARLADLQGRLLRRAFDLVTPGGTLLYATCSLEPQECEAQISKILGSGLAIERKPIAASEIAGLGQCITPDGDLRTLPCHAPWPEGAAPGDGGMDGFFAARLVRTA
ncbi:RsmB/NOP family class I SAM-dependent RNA methyltransferase [Microbaculum marinisediminis]|uniref:Methyltransferase domain-containing protein n=1 Tax=Microbaculum marinisediminis TaxID=2931392 RepID=A0AAW5QWP5_9HYPH|nr:transcription antitermination factor NusB [Microbaculum sp. A6E488]MCT8972375.1 methyltransferase domain-containing protein [Microbaculum sp. A6E488]